MTDQILTQETLKALIHYDPLTGVFTWLERDRKWFPSDQSWKIWNTRFGGKATGSLHNCGYLVICIFYKRYLAHRLAFLYMTGSFPPHEVDHEKGIRRDNRWGELTAATHQENGKNSKLRKDNTSGHIGVCTGNGPKAWRAYIVVGGKQLHLGHFDEKCDAISARKAAENKYGFHPNHGRIQ